MWQEVGVTICVTDEPPQFVKFTYGREAAAADDPDEIAAVEEQLYRECEEVVARRARRLVRRLQRTLNSG